MRKTIRVVAGLLLGACACAPALRGGGARASSATAEAAAPNGGRSPAHSPDGSMIAFLSSTLHTPPDLWVMKADGTGARRLTTRGVMSFGWAADGRSIVFVTRRKGYEEVMSVALDGKGERRLPGLPPGASPPISSPDGKLFAFTAPGEQNARDLWIGTADGTRIEAVTEKIGVRSLLWHPGGRKVYFEAGRSYGVGLWELDVSTIEGRVLVNKYIGTPAFSARAGLFAFPYPLGPGEFEVHTLRPDGTGAETHAAPRLEGRWLAWDAAGSGVYYLGKDLDTAPPEEKAPPAGEKVAPPHAAARPAARRVGVTALWRLDLATGAETRLSPPNLHLVDFDPSPGGGSVVVTGVVEQSTTPELFRLDLASGGLTPLAAGRASSWMPIPSPDASRIAFFSNEGAVEAITVASHAGDPLAAYPGFALEGDTRIFWLPASDGLAVFSGRGLFAFREKGPIDFPGKADHRAYLGADASIHEDKVLFTAIPRYGETPGLYLVEAVGDAFVQTDLRAPPPPDVAAKLYQQPRWSLDGQKVAFTDGVDVWTMRADGTQRRRITRHAEEREEGRGRDAVASYPVWSVRGERLVHTLTVHEGKRVVRELWLTAADGTGAMKLFEEELDSQFQVFQPEYTHPPFFDASDERVIFTAARDGIPDVHAVRVADGEVRRLTQGGAIYPALLPEEDTIVYTSLRGNDERIWIMAADGTGHRPFLKPRPPPQGGTEREDAAAVR